MKKIISLILCFVMVLPENITPADVVSELAIPVDWNEMVEGVGDMLAKFDEIFKS